jgi:hypothetical protein
MADLDYCHHPDSRNCLVWRFFTAAFAIAFRTRFKFLKQSDLHRAGRLVFFSFTFAIEKVLSGELESRTTGMRL